MMIKTRICTYVLNFALACSFSVSAQAADAEFGNPFDGPDAVFSENVKVDDEALDDMRGGFLLSNGMFLDISWNSSTFLDGNKVDEVILNNINPSTFDSSSLKSVLQFGPNNTVFDTSSLPNVVNIIQNTLSDVKIQQFNTLEVQAKNYGNFIRQSIGRDFSFQSALKAGL